MIDEVEVYEDIFFSRGFIVPFIYIFHPQNSVLFWEISFSLLFLIVTKPSG